MAENFPNLMIDVNINIQEAQWTLRWTKRPILRNIIKFSKDRTLKAAEQKWIITHKGYLLRISVDFSSETLDARRQWVNIVKELKEKKPVSQESYIQQNCPLKLREKLRHSQINKSWRSLWSLNCPARNAEGSHSEKNERTLDNDLELYGEINVNTWEIIVIITVTFVSISESCFT